MQWTTTRSNVEVHAYSFSTGTFLPRRRAHRLIRSWPAWTHPPSFDCLPNRCSCSRPNASTPAGPPAKHPRPRTRSTCQPPLPPRPNGRPISSPITIPTHPPKLRDSRCRSRRPCPKFTLSARTDGPIAMFRCWSSDSSIWTCGTKTPRVRIGERSMRPSCIEHRLRARRPRAMSRD